MRIGIKDNGKVNRQYPSPSKQVKASDENGEVESIVDIGDREEIEVEEDSSEKKRVFPNKQGEKAIMQEKVDFLAFGGLGSLWGPVFLNRNDCGLWYTASGKKKAR